ncbi:hypothetical protein C8F04DRAFT_1296820 [Mycena alexandri]|uniref:Uncharacterized protein n=1 Tax=Mycena alexandri TaxID=1745969 RepID=A0AAD6SHV3_9AGAR|nr:hypothetical protein C8F04DRAFT_1296820 [Mycena alexandri]
MSASGTNEDIVPLLNSAQINWGLAAAELYLYGIYSVLFAFYLYVLRTRHIARTRRFLNIATISLFVFGTAHCAFELARTILSTGALASAQSPRVAQGCLVASSAVYVTSNLIADIIFIFRCYSIWNRRLTIILLPALLVSLTRLGFGYTSVILLIHFFSEKNPAAESHLNTLGADLFIASLSISLFSTALLMGLTVGRIWVLARLARAAGTYYTVCAMILESGALYCVFGIAFVVVGFKVVIDGFSTGAVFGQIVCIAPTLIALRVGLGSGVEDVNSFAVIPRAAQPSFGRTPQARTRESSPDDRILYFIHTVDNKEGAI